MTVSIWIPKENDGGVVMSEENKIIKLLLIDDEYEFRQAASKALARQGFAVSEAESGVQALSMLRDDTPDLVILDLRMGGMDGVSTLEEIKKIKPNLPVIFLTGYGKFEEALSGFKLGIMDFIQKPVDMKDLAERIHKLFSEGVDKPAREKTISELMIPASAYCRLYKDQTVQEIVATLAGQLSEPASVGGAPQRVRRTVLVFDRQEEFIGLIQVEDIVKLMVPLYLRYSPYFCYLPGMFLAQTKMIGKKSAEDLLADAFFIDIEVPLMEAVNLMVSENLTNLAVTKFGKFVGILRDEDIFKEICDSILGK